MASTPVSRPFTPLDAAALALATALGLVMTKWVLDSYDMAEQMLGQRHSLPPFRRLALGSVPLFVSWSLTLLALRFRFSPTRRQMRGPGIATGFAVALFTARDLVEPFAYQHRTNGWAHMRLWGPFGMLVKLPSWLVGTSESAGFAVAATWFALWAGRWWRPERDWIDRGGLVLGGYWIAQFVYHSYRSLAS
jgi:hypothetical protein